MKKQDIPHGVYANLNWFNNYLNVANLLDYKIWLAQWEVVKPTANFRYDYWQYSSNGQVDGVQGRVDLDISYVDNSVENVDKKLSNEEIADEVIRGVWGNGENRKNNLRLAGYNPDVIQKIVNEKLSYKTNDQIADEVIKGLWGNGQDRKNKLTKAGYNASEIQRIVNQKLSK